MLIMALRRDGDLRILNEQNQMSVGSHVAIISACAIASGLSIPIAWFGIRRVSVMRWINAPGWRDIFTFTLVCLVSYLAAGFIVLGVKWLRRSSLSWLFVSVFGSMILAIIYKFQLYEVGGVSVSSQMSIAQVSDALESALWLSMFTLPFSVAVYFMASALSLKFRRQAGEGGSR